MAGKDKYRNFIERASQTIMNSQTARNSLVYN